MELRLLGDVEVHDGRRPIPLPRAGERCVLASLALEPGRRLHVDTLIDRFWGDDPPTGAGHTIASYVRTVRKAIEEAGGQRSWLRNHRPAAYQLDIDPSRVDYHRFTALIAGARRRQRDRSPADAVALYRKALHLRRGEVLGGVTGQWAANCRYAIGQEHLAAVCALYEQQLAIGEHSSVATHAAALVMEVVPTDRMIALAIHGLARSGQHAAIRGFLARATKRMWDTVQARPSSEVRAIASQLVANPNATLRLPPTALAGAQPADPPAPDGVQDTGAVDQSAADAGGPAPPGPVRGGFVVMTAEHNQQVYQAGGDQYIGGT